MENKPLEQPETAREGIPASASSGCYATGQQVWIRPLDRKRYMIGTYICKERQWHIVSTFSRTQYEHHWWVGDNEIKAA